MKFTILAILASFGLTVLLPVVVHSPPRVSAQFVPRQMIEGPYWTVQSGFESWLMVSNTSDEPIQVFPEFFAANGQRVELPVLALRQRERQHLNLRQWLSAQKVTFTWGSLRFRHTGKEFSLAAQVTVTQPEASWSFDFPLDNRDWFYRSTVLDGLWWLPDESSVAQLILTNTGEQPVTVRPTLLINGQPRALAAITLQPHQARQVSLGEALAALNLTAPLPTNGGLRIEHDGEPGDVLAYVMVHNDQGFSTTIRCVDPAMHRSRSLHGAGLFIKPSSVPGVSLTSFDTLLLLGNTTGADIQATVRVTYTVGLLTKTATLPALRLAPYQVKQLALNEALARAGLPRRIDSAGLEIAYTSEPGSVVAHAVSFDRSASMAFDVLIKDPDALPTNTFAFPWRLTGQTRSVVQIKNARQEVGQFQLKLVHEAGEWDWGVQPIGPGQTVTLDIRALRDRQIASDQDQVIPRWIERGQAQWTDVSPQRGLIGRVIIYDPRLKINTSTNEWGGGDQNARPWGCIRWGVEGSEGPCVSGPSGPNPNQPPVTQSLPLGQALELPVWGKRVECDTGALFQNVNISTWGALTFTANPPNRVTIEKVVQGSNRFVRISRIQAGTVDVTAQFTTDFYWPNCEPISGDGRVLTATLTLTEATVQITAMRLDPIDGNQLAPGCPTQLHVTVRHSAGLLNQEIGVGLTWRPTTCTRYVSIIPPYQRLLRVPTNQAGELTFSFTVEGKVLGNPPGDTGPCLITLQAIFTQTPPSVQRLDPPPNGDLLGVQLVNASDLSPQITEIRMGNTTFPPPASLGLMNPHGSPDDEGRLREDTVPSFRRGQTTPATLVIRGRRLRPGTGVRLETDPPDGANPTQTRVFPTIRNFTVVPAAGGLDELTVTLDVSAPGLNGFYTLIVSNCTSTCTSLCGGALPPRTDYVIFEVTPTETVVDGYTPDRVMPGQFYMYSICGLNLQHAQVTLDPPGLMQIHEEHRDTNGGSISGILEVPVDTPVNESAPAAHLVVSGSNTTPIRLPITVIPLDIPFPGDQEYNPEPQAGGSNGRTPKIVLSRAARSHNKDQSVRFLPLDTHEESAAGWRGPRTLFEVPIALTKAIGDYKGPALYMQPMVWRADWVHRPGRVDADQPAQFGFNVGFQKKLVDFRFQKMIGFCGAAGGPELGACVRGAQAMPPGAVREVLLATVNLYMRVDLRVTWRVDIHPGGVSLSWPLVCVRVHAGVETIGGLGAALSVDYCSDGSARGAIYENVFSAWPGGLLDPFTFAPGNLNGLCFTRAGQPIHEVIPNYLSFSRDRLWYHTCTCAGPNRNLRLYGQELAVASGIERVFFDWGRLTFTPFPIPLRPYPRRIQDRLILFDVETTADTVVLDAPLVEPRISNVQWSVPDVDVTNGPQQATLWVSVQIPNRPEAQELDVIVKAERDTDPSRTTLNTQAPRVLHSLPTRINPGQTRTIGLTVAGINLNTGVEGLLAYDVTFSLDFGNHFLTCPTDSNFPRSFPGDVLVIRRTAPQITIEATGPEAICEGKQVAFSLRVMNLPPLVGRVRLSFVTNGAGRATFEDGTTEKFLSNSQVNTGFPVPVTIMGRQPSSREYDIALKAEVIEIPNPPTPELEYFTVADSIVTKDVIVVAWVNGNAPDIQQTLRNTQGVSPELIAALNTAGSCERLMFDWWRGTPRLLVDAQGRRIEANQRYANAWLMSRSANEQPPTDLSGNAADNFAGDTGKYRLFARFQVDMCVLNGKFVGTPVSLKQVAKVGETRAPCPLIWWDADGEDGPDNGMWSPSDMVRIGLMNQGRIGRAGQAVNATINCRTTPYVWSNIIFSALRNDGNYDQVRNEMFPTYWVYIDGMLSGRLPQIEVERFIEEGTRITGTSACP